MSGHLNDVDLLMVKKLRTQTWCNIQWYSYICRQYEMEFQTNFLDLLAKHATTLV